jgi:hypothetical protein
MLVAISVAESERVVVERRFAEIERAGRLLRSGRRTWTASAFAFPQRGSRGEQLTSRTTSPCILG